jgi:DNA-binding transcriptional MerR regulator
MNRHISIGDASRLLECHPATVKNLVRKGLLTCYRDYRGWRFFDADEVERLRMQRTAPPAPENRP